MVIFLTVWAMLFYLLLQFPPIHPQGRKIRVLNCGVLSALGAGVTVLALAAVLVVLGG